MATAKASDESRDMARDMATAKRKRAVAPWVRTRLRTTPGAAAALGVLVLLTAFLAAAYPRALTQYETEGLRHQLADAPAAKRVVQVQGALPGGLAGPEERAAVLGPERMAAAFEQTLKAPKAPLVPVRADSAHGVRVPQRLVASDPWLPRPTKKLSPVFSVSTRAELADHSRLIAGRQPAAPPGTGTGGAGGTGGASGTGGAVTGQQPVNDLPLEAAVSSATARALHLKVGSVVHIAAEQKGITTGNTAAVKVTGIFEPLRPASPYWSVDRNLHTPELLPNDTPDGPEYYWSGSLLLPPAAAPALLHLTPDPEPFWSLAPRTGQLRMSDAQPLTEAVANLESGPGLSALRQYVGAGSTVDTDLELLVTAYLENRAAITPVVAVAAFGTGTVAAVVILMAGGLAGARRHSELALIRARGGSVRGLLGRLLAELAVVVVPAAALGWAAAFWLLPGSPPTASAVAAAAVAVLACAGLPVRAAFAHLRPRVHGDRADLVRAKPSRRRNVAELTLVVLTVAAVVALRRRGTGDEVDQLVSAAPVLVGVIASLVLIRLYPLPLRVLARPMALRRGAVGFLSAARAARSPATATLPLLALLLALTTAAFGGSVLAGVSDSRDRAATTAVGADARLVQIQRTKYGFDARTVSAVRNLPGVREVSAVGIDYMVSLPDGKRDVTLVTVDPESYARLSRGSDNGGFDAAALAGSGGSGGKGGVFPVLASPETAGRLGGAGRIDLRSARYGDFTTRLAGTLRATPALREGDFLVVSAAAFPTHKPASLLVTGDGLDRGALQAAAGGTAEVHLKSEARAKFVSPPLQRGAERIYTTAVAAGAGFAVLAVLLSLLQAAPERTALLARLRTMGVTRRQGRRLLVLESLPQALLAACGGALAGWATVRLLAPDIDLGILALATRTAAAGSVPLLHTDPWSLFLPALAVVCLAAGVAAGQAWWATRRTTTTTELRAGDAR